MFSLGWLDDLPRFQSLRNLNLADNDLGHFPAAVLLLPAVTELNLAGNKLYDLPPQISKLRKYESKNVVYKTNALSFYTNLFKNKCEQILHLNPSPSGFLSEIFIECLSNFMAWFSLKVLKLFYQKKFFVSHQIFVRLKSKRVLFSNVSF